MSEPNQKKAEAKVREADRVLWAVKGILELRVQVNVILGLLMKFRKFDVVPTHYNYPELFYL